MNILYFSHILADLANGPSYSVPAQIQAQADYDRVFWWNLTEAVQQHWLDTGLFHGVKDFPKGPISSLPAPFDRPDLVVFEDFYYIDDYYHSLECRLRRIPYVVVPRGALTKQGQAQKRLKKALANPVAFGPMVRRAAAVQFLTRREREDSGRRWNRKPFIMPNGTRIVADCPARGVPDGRLSGVWIGRFDPWHKGLDLLLDAVDAARDQLRAAKLSIELYGPERMGCRAAFTEQAAARGLDDLLLIRDGVFGVDKARVLRERDFFILTSRYEGMPMALVEALSYGLPCLVSEGTNMAEEIGAHQAGWTCENSADSIREALLRLIRERGRFPEYSRNARALSLQYDWREIARQTHEIYWRILYKE